MVKIDYLKWHHDDEVGLAFIVDQYATLQEIDEKAADYAHKTMWNNAKDSKVIMPIYLVDSHNMPPENPARHIGFISMSIIDSLINVEHLTLDKSTINSEWNAIDFYSGKYGLISTKR
ncbi:hypothetical protein [Aliivibrio fischeri]|uniref:hypothetical protein n=1 Tax=Aliivibrio fischeri TaxID=668 RepID=UPI0012D9870B|nr:hypothetical protein [Aliivibrio fischeri]MUJ20460.1 hypothetical protein [Aliivibrio fischeri]